MVIFHSYVSLPEGKPKPKLSSQWIWGTAKGYPTRSATAGACSRPRNDKRCSTALEKIQGTPQPLPLAVTCWKGWNHELED